MIEALCVGILFIVFVFFVFAIFGVIFAAAVYFSDIGTKSASKPKFEPYITEDEQNSLATRFGYLSFEEIPHFMYGRGNFPPRCIQMQFSHQSRCYINVTKDINKKCFKYEVRYKKTVIKTFDDWDSVGDFCWNLSNSYRDNPDLVLKRLNVEKRVALAAGDFE